LWPTPNASEGSGGAQPPDKRKAGRHQVRLRDAVRWPTTQDAANNGAPSQAERNTKPLNAEVGGSLNPFWVEWLMGWPPGWTSLDPLPDEWMRAWRSGETGWHEDPADRGAVSRIAASRTKHRTARLKALGNGQVPAAAALAWQILILR
jgi:hypothetical protein